MAGDFTEEWDAAELAAAEARQKGGAQPLEPTESLGPPESGEPTRDAAEPDANAGASYPDANPSASEWPRGDEWPPSNEFSGMEVDGRTVPQGSQIVPLNAPVSGLPHPGDDIWRPSSDTCAATDASHADSATVVMKDRDRVVPLTREPDPSVWDEIVQRRHKVEPTTEPGVFRRPRVPERALARPVSHWPLTVVLGVLFVMGILYFLWWRH